MSRLLLVRHAQASFFERDYDQLSPLGEEQARLLGQYWSEQNFSFDRIYSGPRQRQKATAQIVGQEFCAAGRAFPEPTVMEEFDEYPGDVVLRQTLPHLLESDGQIRAWHREYLAEASRPEKLRYFQRIFEAVIRKWVAGDLPAEGAESWPQFCARVNGGISEIVSRAAHHQQLAVFCSGGPIGVAIERALNLSPQDTLRTVWMSRNCSYSEFLFSGGRFTLSAFNAFPHLHASLLTYR